MEIIWKDIGLRSNDPVVIGSSSIREAINNLLSTSPSQKLFNPDFGCDLDSLSFELSDELLEILIKRELIKCLENWDPRIRVNSQLTTVTRNPDDYTADVLLVIDVYGITESLKLAFSVSLE